MRYPKLLLPLNKIFYDEKFNTRGPFTPQSVSELADSIKVSGLIQDLTVRPWTDLPYHLVCGHRRYQAVKLLGWTEVKCNVLELSDHDARMLNLQENLARQDLTPSQELAAILAMYGSTPVAKDVAKDLGKSKKWVNERLAIQRLHASVRRDVDSGLLTAWDISMLLPCPHDQQVELAAQLKLAHSKGASSSSVFAKVAKARRVRNKTEIQLMITNLIDQHLEPPGWRCLAWAAGTLTDEELLDKSE